MIRKIQHIGVAVRRLDDAIPYYRDVLGLECLGVEEVADQKIRAAKGQATAMSALGFAYANVGSLADWRKTAK